MIEVKTMLSNVDIERVVRLAGEQLAAEVLDPAVLIQMAAKGLNEDDCVEALTGAGLSIGQLRSALDRLEKEAA